MFDIYSLVEQDYLAKLDPRKAVMDLPKSKMDKENSIYVIWFAWKKEVQKQKGKESLTLYSRFWSDRPDLEASTQFERMLKLMFRNKNDFAVCQIWVNNKKGNKRAVDLPDNEKLIEMVGVGRYTCLELSHEQLALYRLHYVLPIMQEREMLD